MCDEPKNKNEGISDTISAERAGRELARLMERQLGYIDGHIDSIALRLFIRAYWSRVARLARVIHDEGDR